MKKLKNNSKSVLLTTVHGPLGIVSDNCTRNIQAEMYHAQVTRAQGVFSIRTICTGWGIEFIAANLSVPVTVLHYPTKRILINELKKNYDYVGISFVICTFPKTIEACSWVRKYASNSKIVLGGYGTVLSECDQYADFVCREEGVNFFRKLLGKKETKSFVIPLIKRNIKIMSITTQPEAIIPTGLGCSRGCDFCCTSHFFNKNYIPLIKTGREIHDVMRSINFPKSTSRNIGIIDEDFLADRHRLEDLIVLNSQEIKKPILFSCLTSLSSLSQYTTDELLNMGLSGAWVGVESIQANYTKLHGINVNKLINSLKEVGIIPLISMIIGFDWHNEDSIEKDFQYLISLKPALSQFMVYSPCPQTPLFKIMTQQKRLLNVPHIYHDGFHALMKHPHLSPERIEEILSQLFQREYEELGPSVCRIMDILHKGYKSLSTRSNSLYNARAQEYKNTIFKIYPVLKKAIDVSPTHKVKQYLVQLKESVEETFKIPMNKRISQYFVNIPYYYTYLLNLINPNPQPKSEIHHYNFE
jgi:haloalkane dehalogenase